MTKHQIRPSTEVPTVTFLSVGLILMTSVLWAGTPVAIRYSIESFPPIATAALRFALGAAFMLAWCRVEGTSIALNRRQALAAMGAGFLLFVQISLFNLGVAHSNASHGAMLINTFIFWVVAIEHIVTRVDRLSPRKLAGLLIAAAGVVLILTKASGEEQSAESPTLLGDVLLLLSAFVLGIKIVFTKQSLRVIEPSKLILWHDVFGVVLFTVFSFASEPNPSLPPTGPAILGILYQGLFVAGLCFAVQTLLLRRHSASQISVFSFTTPIFGVALAVLFRGDFLSPWLLLGAICVATGILMVNLRWRRES